MSIVPTYYNAEINGVADMYAIATAHGITNPAQAHALKYLLRAGKKPGETFGEAMCKALAACDRAIELHKGGE